MNIYFTNEAMEEIYIVTDESTTVVSYPPKSEEDKKVVEDFGGDLAIRKATVNYAKAMEIMNDRWEALVDFSANFDIGMIISNKLTKAELMQLKMSIFKLDVVKECKDKDLLTKLRKAEDAVDIIMYYGLIRCNVSSAE